MEGFEIARMLRATVDLPGLPYSLTAAAAGQGSLTVETATVFLP
jgi:hypothetical protein